MLLLIPQFPDAGEMLCRPSLALSLPGKGGKSAQNVFRSTKKFSVWLTGNASIAQSRNGVSCVALPSGSQNFSVLCQGWIRLNIHCPLPPLCTDFVSLLFWSVCLVFSSDLDVLSSCQGFFYSPQNELLTTEPKAKIFLDFFLLHTFQSWQSWWC